MQAVEIVPLTGAPSMISNFVMVSLSLYVFGGEPGQCKSQSTRDLMRVMLDLLTLDELTQSPYT